MVQPRRGSQHFRRLARQHTELLGIVDHPERIDVEDFRPRRGVHQLQILRDEVDVGDAARGILQIPVVGLALLLRNRPAHVGDVMTGGDRVARPDQGVADHLLDPLAEFRRGRDDARPRQRHVLPGPGLVVLILREGIDMRGQRPGAARGAQPHVDVVEHAVIGARGEGADQALGEAREVMRALQRALAVGVGIFMIEIIEQDEVEIGGGRHLAAAEAAHGNDGGLLALDAAVL